MARLTLAGGSVLARVGTRWRIRERATVVVEDGRIADVLDAEAARVVRHGEVVDCSGRVVLPGLVNAHAHALEGLFRGAGGELTLLPWIGRTHALMDQLDAAGARVAARLAAVEMLRSGTTAYLDPEVPTDERFDGVVGGLLESGIRAGVTLLLEDRGGYHQWSDRQEPRLSARELGLIDRWGGVDSPIRLFAGPSVLSAVTPALGREVRRLHDERGVRIATHVGEVPEDIEDALARGTAGIVDLAEATHLLAPGAVFTHGVQLVEADLARLAATGVILVHCPSSNAKLGSGIAPLRQMLDAGLTVALGSDGAVCNDGYDLFAEMRLAALLQKAARRDPSAASPSDVLTMATTGGAAALGIEAGRIEPGALADLALVDLSRLGSWPTANVVDSLVFATSASNVTDVFVGGEARVRDGRLVGVDTVALLRDARDVAGEAILAAGLAGEITPG